MLLTFFKLSLTIGPSHWGEQFNTCMGKHQSPIDIDSLHVKHVSLPELSLRGFSLEPDKMSVTNNGHTGKKWFVYFANKIIKNKQYVFIYSR